MKSWFPLAVLAATALAACKGEVGDKPSPSNLHPDLACNTPAEALANAECRLTLGVESQEYIQELSDKDVFVVNTGTLPARAIVHVTAGYRPGTGQDAGNFNTAVNLQVNVLENNNGVFGPSQTTGVDKHGSNPPTILDLTFRYTKSNTDLFLLLNDDTGKKLDGINPYFVKVEVLSDPDTNEPNDTTPTPIALSPSGAGTSGTGGGYLATPGDVDLYSVVSPGPNYVMWIRVGEDPAFPAPPPHRFRLEYKLIDPTNVTVATDSASAGSQFSAALMQVGTARLLAKSGTYTLLVRGYLDPNSPGTVPSGDLGFKYKVEVIVVPLQDPAEPNNTIEDAAAKASADLVLAPGGSGTIQGRISFVPDPDWYRVNLNGASAGPHLLHYRVTPSTGPARFPPVPGPKDRALTVTTILADRSPAAQVECAKGDAGVCIISANGNNSNYSLATNACQLPTPQCLQSTRFENQDQPTPKFQDLKNFEGVLQVPPHAGPVDYFFKFEDLGNNWADDTNYTIEVDWRAEPDGAEAVPDPRRAATFGTAFTGYLSYGIGATDTSLGIAPITDSADYDGRGDDTDTFQLAVAGGVDQALTFEWDVPSPSLAGMPLDLGFRFGFALPDGGVQTRTTNGGSQLGLIYTDAAVTSWWNTGAMGFPAREPAYDRTFDMGTGKVVTVLRPYACGCLESRFSTPGTMYISVFPINRQTWDSTNVPYTVTAGTGVYPFSFVPKAGGSFTCPSPCAFTKN